MAGSQVEDPDEDIVALIRQGDYDAALEELMQRYGDAVYRYCFRMLGDVALAEDTQQLMFLQAYESFPEFGGRAKVKSWLWKIAHNRTIDAARRRARERDRISDEDDVEVAALGLDPGDQIDDGQIERALRTCVDELPLPTRDALLLHHCHGFTFEEIGAMMGVKPGTVQARARRALVRLQRCIVECVEQDR